jgi:hypothetical protein
MWAAYLPERVKLGAFGDAVLASLVLADEIVVYSFPIDQGQCICALLLPGPQPEGGGGKGVTCCYSNMEGTSCASGTNTHAMGSIPRIS